jgi:hypothetical protein
MPIRHTVEPGDSVLSLSEEHGLFAPTIWDDSANSALRTQRTDMNILLPGDVVVVPDVRLRLEKRPTGKKHRFRRKGLPAIFRIQIFDENIAVANKHFKLVVDGVEQSGKTDSMGIAEKFIPAGSREGLMTIGDNEIELTLQFGYLNPLNDISGIQNRLQNLGYDCKSEPGVLNDETHQALRDFQRNHGVKVTGEPDAATKAKLEQVHDEPYKYPDPEPAG